MAALTYPISVIPQRRLRVVAPFEADPNEFSELPWSFQERPGTAAGIASIAERRRRRATLARRRRLAALLGTFLVLLTTWGVANVLSGLRPHHLERLANSQPAPSGYLYTVQPGDTVWSIATRLDPTGDPRPLVAQIDAQLGGTTSILPGEHIVVP